MIGAAAAAVHALGKKEGSDNDAFNDRDDDEKKGATTPADQQNSTTNGEGFSDSAEAADPPPSKLMLAMSLAVNLGVIVTATFAAVGLHVVPGMMYPGMAGTQTTFTPGPVATVFSAGTAAICVAWGLVDMVSDGFGCIAPAEAQPLGAGRNLRAGEGADAKTPFMMTAAATAPPHTVMYMMDDRTYATMKKGDDMPQNPGGPAVPGHMQPRVVSAAAAALQHGVGNSGGDSMFVSDDVRKSLRQRS